MEGSGEWTTRDLVMYSTLSGCDFIPRLFGMRESEIVAFMKKWKETGTDENLVSLLDTFSNGKKWPKGDGKAGPLAIDFADKFHKCVGLMLHAPVIAEVDGEFKIIPMSELPSSSQNWEDVIGFDPLSPFIDVSIADVYELKLWARSGASFPDIKQQIHPKDSERLLPHGAMIDFKYMPVCVVPSTVLLLWLVYHGITHPKDSLRNALVTQVKRAIEMEVVIDEERLRSTEYTTAKSYVSWDAITIHSEVQWNNSGDEMLEY